MSKKVILHLGMHKTGSTALQAFLVAHAANLLQHRSVLVPEAGRPMLGEQLSDGHHQLAWMLDEDRSLHRERHCQPDVFARLRREIDDSAATTVILSSEELDALQRPEIERLAAELDGHDLQVVVYLRRQDQYVQAMYFTEIAYQRGKVADIEAFIHSGRCGSLDYAALLENWATVFGRERVVARRYERRQLLGGNVVKDFMDAVGIRIPWAREDLWKLPEVTLNRTLPKAFLDALIAARELGLSDMQQAQLRRLLLRVVPRKAELDLLSPRQCQTLLASLEAGNRQLFERWFGGVPFDWGTDALGDIEQAQLAWEQQHAKPNGFLDPVLRALLRATRDA